MALAAKGVLPLLLLAGLLALFVRVDPTDVFRAAFPPIEELTFERIAFPQPGLIRVHMVNGGPEPVTVAQVMVDDAYWEHTVVPDREVGRLEDIVLEIPYPWVDGDPLIVTIVSSTGVTFTQEVAVATQSPQINRSYVVTFALLGLYVGVIPVFLGLLWLPFLAGVSQRWIDFFLSFTVGLLLFLGVDALEGAFELTGQVASAFQGVGLIVLGVVGTPLVIHAVGRVARGDSAITPLGMSMLIAIGIGLHNLGEGLAIGSSYAVGEVALGTSLVFGFLLHNTTEGLGIVAPLARSRPSYVKLVALGLIAGVPTIFGTWIGGFSYSPTASVLFLAIGAGAIVQVISVLGRSMGSRGREGFKDPLNAAGVVVGLIVMYTTGLFVAA
ncbi:MAG: metal transporter [Gemmatimonadetes bacterium]|nr:metal transporter [Gemmatimonadota bacterium]MCH8811421.1 metal transporter [Gemmatimonadota bacterium]